MNLYTQKSIDLFIASPRGFCAGVDRAIKILEQVLEKYGKPIYAKHEIVHNKYVVKSLTDRGVIFVENLEDCPSDRPVVFSAHGVDNATYVQAKERNMQFIDATCPLVSKVHMEVISLEKQGYEIIFIGHSGHPEVLGTLGQMKDKKKIHLVENISDAKNINLDKCYKLALVTQTTLSVFETKNIIDLLKSKYSTIRLPKKEDICYATTNRQLAVIKIAKSCDLVFVVGSKNSSNSLRLTEAVEREGCKAMLIDGVNNIDLNLIANFNNIGITAGASAPEHIVQEVIKYLSDNFHVKQIYEDPVDENVVFKVPKL